MKVTSTSNVDFPKLGFAINAGEVRDPPEDADAQAQILAHPDIIEVKPKKEKRDTN